MLENNLTPTQAEDLKNFQATGELNSLENIFFRDCFEVLYKEPEILEYINSKLNTYRIEFDEDGDTYRLQFFDWADDVFDFYENELNKDYLVSFIMLLLSRREYGVCDCGKWDDEGYKHFPSCTNLNPTNVAVMPFLDVPYKEMAMFREIIANTEWGNSQDAEASKLLANSLPQTLDHLTFREFTERLREGETIDEIKKTITKLYLLQAYVQN